MLELKSEEAVLEIDRLKVNFYTYEGVVKAIDEVSFALEDGDTLGIVGETGCGKSVTALSILRLILPPGRIESGCILYGTKDSCIDLVQKNDEFMRSIRGNDISMIFQEAGNALNPVLSVGDQVNESFLLHRQQELCESVLKRIAEKRDRLSGKSWRGDAIRPLRVLRQESDRGQKRRHERQRPAPSRSRGLVMRIALGECS